MHGLLPSHLTFDLRHGAQALMSHLFRFHEVKLPILRPQCAAHWWEVDLGVEILRQACFVVKQFAWGKQHKRFCRISEALGEGI